MKMEKEIRKEIFDKVVAIYKLRSNQKNFIPGKTKINYAGRIYNEKEIINLVDASLDFWLTTGRYAKKFEKEFAKFLGAKYCLLTNSGSSANLLAISTLTSPKLGTKKLKPGDEIISTACGFPTTVNPIIQNNLIPVFIDVDIGTYNIQVDKIEESITEKTKAIIIAHTLGNPANLDKIIDIVKKYDLWFIEDNCDSLGSKYKGRFTGTFGHISTCSFYPAHHITMGEGGAVLTNDIELKKIIVSFRDWGRDCWCEPGHDNTCGKRFTYQLGKLPIGYDHKYIYSHLGYNLKITDMQAAIGCAQLEKLPSFIKRRQKNWNRLYKIFKNYDDYFILPQQTKQAKMSPFGFVLTINDKAPFKRSDIVNFFEKNNIQTRMIFSGNIVRQPCMEGINFKTIGDLKNSDKIMNDTFWLGVYPGLTDEMIIFIEKKLNEFMKR